MKKVFFAFTLFFFGFSLFALQKYKIEVYDGHYVILDETFMLAEGKFIKKQVVDGEIIRLPDDKKAVIELSEKQLDEMAECKRKIVEHIAEINVKSRAESHHNLYNKSLIATEFLLQNSDKADSLLLTLKNTEIISYTQDGKIIKHVEDENAQKLIKIGVPTLIIYNGDHRRIKDKVPFWGDIPIAGRLFHSEGWTMSSKYFWVLITPAK